MFPVCLTLYITQAPSSPFTLPVSTSDGFGMGDIRNKLNKIERAREEKAAFDAWSRRAGIEPTPQPNPLPSERYPKCACGLTVHETTIWQCGRDGYFCLCCMPLKWKQDLFGHMLNCGVAYDPEEHGEDTNDPPR